MVSEAVLLASWVLADADMEQLARKLEPFSADELVTLLEEGPSRFCALLQEHDAEPETCEGEPEVQRNPAAEPSRPLVTPIQASELLRKLALKRLLALDRDDFAAVATSMR